MRKDEEYAQRLAPCGHSTPCGCRSAARWAGKETTCCMECPFPLCLSDGFHPRKLERDMAIVAAYRAGESAESLALRYNLSSRSVYRIIKEELNG